MHLSSACATPKLALLLSCLNLVYTTQEGYIFRSWGLKRLYQSVCRHLCETRMPRQIRTRCTAGFSNIWLESNPFPSLTFSHLEIQSLMVGKMSITTVLTRMKWGASQFPDNSACTKELGLWKECRLCCKTHFNHQQLRHVLLNLLERLSMPIIGMLIRHFLPSSLNIVPMHGCGVSR